jgi:hypothetical protein
MALALDHTPRYGAPIRSRYGVQRRLGSANRTPQLSHDPVVDGVHDRAAPRVDVSSRAQRVAAVRSTVQAAAPVSAVGRPHTRPPSHPDRRPTTGGRPRRARRSCARKPEVSSLRNHRELGGFHRPPPDTNAYRAPAPPGRRGSERMSWWAACEISTVARAARARASVEISHCAYRGGKEVSPPPAPLHSRPQETPLPSDTTAQAAHQRPLPRRRRL